MADIVDFSDKTKKRFELVRFGSVKKNTDTPYLIRDLIPAHGLVLVWGPPKCGKSFWLFDAAMHVALELQYRDLRPQPFAPPNVVVYIALEGGRAFANRVEAWRQYHQVADAPFYLIVDQLSLIDDAAILANDIYHQTMGIGHIGLIVIDTLNRSLLGSENKDEDMSAYIKAADFLRLHFDCTVAVVHHCGIEGNRPRGHTSLSGAVDAQIAISRGADRLVVAKVEWMKDGTDDLTLVSKLEPVELGLDDGGEPISSCVCIAAAGIPTQPPVKSKPPPKSTALLVRILEAELAERGSEHRPFGNGLIVHAVPADWVREEYYRQTPAEEPSAKRQAFYRAVKDGQAANLVAMRDNFIWLTFR